MGDIEAHHLKRKKTLFIALRIGKYKIIRVKLLVLSFMDIELE